MDRPLLSPHSFQQWHQWRQNAVLLLKIRLNHMSDKRTRLQVAPTAPPSPLVEIGLDEAPDDSQPRVTVEAVPEEEKEDQQRGERKMQKPGQNRGPGPGIVQRHPQKEVPARY